MPTTATEAALRAELEARDDAGRRTDERLAAIEANVHALTERLERIARTLDEKGD